MACYWLMVTSFSDNNWPSGPGVWVCSPTKLQKKIKINRRQSKKPPSLRLHGLISESQYLARKPHQPQLVFMRVLYPGLIGIWSVGFCEGRSKKPGFEFFTLSHMFS